MYRPANYQILFLFTSGKEVIVFLPDQGFFCTVKIKQIWELEPRFKLLPFQALSASIPIESPGLTDRWSNDAVQIFKVGSGNKMRACLLIIQI